MENNDCRESICIIKLIMEFHNLGSSSSPHSFTYPAVLVEVSCFSDPSSVP